MVYQLACWPVGTDQRPLYDCLEVWGQHQSQITIFEALKGKLSPAVDLLCLDKLGHAHRHLGEFQQAQNYHETHLKLAQERGDRKAEMSAYWGLSTLNNHRYEYAKKSELSRLYCQHHYRLACDLGDRYQQSKALCQWGRSYHQNLDFNRGLPLLKKSLEIAKEIKNQSLEVQALEELGAIHFFAGNYQKSQFYLGQAISEKYSAHLSKDPILEIRILMTLCFNYYLSNQINKGNLSLETVTSRCQIINDVSLELFTLNNIAVCLSQYGIDRNAAIAYSQKALDLSLRIGFFRVAIANAGHLAVLYGLQQSTIAAKHWLKTAIALYRQHRHVLDSEGKGIFFAYVAHARWLQGQYWGLFNLVRALILLPPWSSANGRLIWRKAVATLTPPWLRSLRNSHKL